MKIIDPFWFLLALAVGIFFTYIFESEYKTVIKYPHPGKNITYKDYDNMCYKYIPTENIITTKPIIMYSNVDISETTKIYPTICATYLSMHDNI